MPQLQNGNPSVKPLSGKPKKYSIKIKSNGDSKTKIMIVGNLLDKYLRREELSPKKNNVKVITLPGSTTEDILEYIKPISRRKHDTMIIHTGTNDLSNSVDTMKKVIKVVKIVCTGKNWKKLRSVFPGVFYRKDKDHQDERDEVNMKLKKYCEGKGFVFIKNANINESGLNNSKLHFEKYLFFVVFFRVR